MSAAQIFYVGGMSVICVGFPTFLVGIWALQSLQARELTRAAAPARARRAKAHAQAAGAPYSA